MKTKRLKLIFTTVLSMILVLGLFACKENLIEINYQGETLENGYVNTTYNDSIATATGIENIQYALKSGSTLPDGLSLSTDGAISGTPTLNVINHTFTVVASAENAISAEAEFNITISLLTMIYNGSDLVDGAVGVSYNESIATATGTTDIQYMLKSGNSLPDGLTLSLSGLITGTPTTNVSDYTFMVVASSSSATSAEAEFTITIKSTIAYTSVVLDDGYTDAQYSVNIGLATGAEGIAYTLKDGDTLPAGLTLATSGVISGVPTTVVTDHSFSIIASAPNAVSKEASFVISILENTNNGNEYTITYDDATLTDGQIGTSYNANIATATGTTNILYSLKTGSTLPAGLSLSANGTLSGIPTSVLTDYTFIIVATGNNATPDEATFTLTIEPYQIAFDSITLDDGEVDAVYNQDIALATGATGIEYSLKSGSDLPAGLSLSTMGIITGTPTVDVTNFTFTVVASAVNASSAEATFSITINRPLQQYIFETELTNIDDLEGGGISGAPGTPLDMIQPSDNASGGYYLGFTHKTDLTVTYEFTSDIATTGSLTLGLGTELQSSMIINPSVLEVTVNGVVVSFSEFEIPENVSFTQEFTEFTISGNIGLLAGANVITVRVLANDYLNGGTGAPMMDNISIMTDGLLNWVPKTSNLE